MNDYILESADVTNVSIDDIEYEKQLAEINVIEAMINCYEKQLMLMEYNEESACEIMMESGIIMESDDKRPLSVKAKAVFNRMISALKTLVLSIIDQIETAPCRKLLKTYQKSKFKSTRFDIDIDKDKFKNQDSIYLIENFDIIDKNLDYLIDGLDFLYDKSCFVGNESHKAAVVNNELKKECMEKCDKVIDMANHMFDNDKKHNPKNSFNDDDIKQIFSWFDGGFIKQLRKLQHCTEKWNTVYGENNIVYNTDVEKNVRNATRVVIKAYTRLQRAIIPIIKTLNDIFKTQDSNKIKATPGVTAYFKNAVRNNNVSGVRIMMKDSLLADPSFQEFAAMEKCAAPLKDLYVPYDGEELNQSPTEWNKDYMNLMLAKLLFNFSHERIEHLKKIIRHLYPTESNKTKST
jgi:hypothetical protein